MLASQRVKPIVLPIVARIVARIVPINVLFTLFCLTGIALADEALSVEFLNYLAEFESGEEEWIDPLELEMMAQLGSARSDGTEEEIDDE